MTDFNYKHFDNDNCDSNNIDDGLEFIDDDFEYDDSDYDDDDSYLYKSDDSETFTNEVPKSKKNSFGSEVFSFIKLLVLAAIVAFLFTRFIIVNAQVPSGSMENTILTGDRLIGFRLAYTFSEPKRGDIVIFKYPDDESQNFVKRIIGIPGDVIQISNGNVYVNGNMLTESYIREPMNDEGEELTYVVPADSYFMLGDNRNNSKDSRYWTNTFVKKDKIIAKVSFRYFNVKTKRISFKIIK